MLVCQASTMLTSATTVGAARRLRMDGMASAVVATAVLTQCAGSASSCPYFPPIPKDRNRGAGPRGSMVNTARAALPARLNVTSPRLLFVRVLRLVQSSYARLTRLFPYRKWPVRGEADARRQRPASVVFSVNGGSRLSRDQRPDRVCCHGWPAALEPAVREERT
jgi:hypothetical protein